MNQQESVDQQAEQFLHFYKNHRQQHQIHYYTNRIKEFESAQRQVIWGSIILAFLTAVAGILQAVFPGGIKFTLLLIAAICPILSTALAGFSALYGFAQQTKIYQDARRSLESVCVPEVQRAMTPADFSKEISQYVSEVEGALQTERGFWGQLAPDMTPQGI